MNMLILLFGAHRFDYFIDSETQRLRCKDIHPVPLAEKPHDNALSINLGFHNKCFFILRQNLGRGEPVENGVHTGAGIAEADALESPGIHELYPFTEFTFLKPVGIWK